MKPLIDAIANFILLNPGAMEGEVDPDEDVFKQDPADLIPSMNIQYYSISLIFSENHQYLAYTGSLTTKDPTGVYLKCVSWNVLYQPITISQNQVYPYE